MVIEEEQRQTLSEWFSSTLLKAGSPTTNVVVVGTLLHHDALLATLLNPQKKGMIWKRHVYRPWGDSPIAPTYGSDGPASCRARSPTRI